MQGKINCVNNKLFSKFLNFLVDALWHHFLTGAHMNSRVKWGNAVSTQSQKNTLLFQWTLWGLKMISYIVWHLKLLPPFKSFTAKSLNTIKTMRKNCQFCWPPVPTVAIFFNIVASIYFLKVSYICFQDGAHYKNDDKIKILNALICAKTYRINLV